MTKKQLKKGTKRTTLHDKYKIQKRVKEHHRKLRKEARKAKKNGLAIKQRSKLTRIPNLYPHKKEEIIDQDLKKALERLAKKKNGLITEEDIENLVAEESGQVVLKSSDNKN